MGFPIRHSGSELSSLIIRFVSCLTVSLLYNNIMCPNAVSAVNWDHTVDLNEDFRILWTIINQDITFEVQARTLGYVGFGFSTDGNLSGADLAVGWVDRGQTYFQDRHITRNGNTEPVVDSSQDYILILGYENTTHTVLRFRRKLDTCDTANDIPITDDTMRIVYMYSESDPKYGSMGPGSLPEVGDAFRAYRPLMLTQKAQPKSQRDDRVRVLELRNEDVELPSGDDTLYWCKMFKLEDINRKHHLIRYEPILDSSTSVQYLQQVTLHECQGSHSDFELMAREQGRQCLGARDMPLACNAIVASWSRGSEGFTFPDEAGYPFDSRLAKYFLMETHYSNLQPDFAQLQAKQMADNSGLKIYLTHVLRPNDAGVLSIGMDPNWRHIIPPGQKHVISEGQCIENCTSYAFPPQGISIFAVMMRTHQIGRQIRLRQIRKTEELPPIAQDSNIDPDYQDFRRLPNTVRSMPGDRLVVECIYNSSSRKAITLGGLTMKEESCTVLTLYYPRQKKLTTCHSLPSLPTVLHSLGIEQLATDSNPVLISSPPEFAGMTLESRLVSYDWENQFDEFQQATRRGSFKPLCWGAKNHIIPGSEYLEGYSINVTKIWNKPRRCKPKRLFVTETIPELELPVLHELDNNNIIEGAARSSRSSATETIGLSRAQGCSRKFTTTFCDSNPVLISSPPEFAGMTLESRLVSYDWENQFDEFQQATRRGSFKPLCWGAKNHIIPGSEYLEGYSINVTKIWNKPRRCKPKRLFVTETIPELELPVLHELDNNNIIEGAARSSRSSATETIGLSRAQGCSRKFTTTFWYTSIIFILKRLSRKSLT